MAPSKSLCLILLLQVASCMIQQGCKFDASRKRPCPTGDCGGVLHCNRAGGNPPVTLAEVTLNGNDGDDFYDISLVEGFNFPMSNEARGRHWQMPHPLL